MTLWHKSSNFGKMSAKGIAFPAAATSLLPPDYPTYQSPGPKPACLNRAPAMAGPTEPTDVRFVEAARVVNARDFLNMVKVHFSARQRGPARPATRQDAHTDSRMHGSVPFAESLPVAAVAFLRTRRALRLFVHSELRCSFRHGFPLSRLVSPVPRRASSTHPSA